MFLKKEGQNGHEMTYTPPVYVVFGRGPSVSWTPRHGGAAPMAPVGGGP